MTNSFIRDVKEVLRRLRNRGISFDANRQYPAIPTIDNTIESHTNALRAIREGMETHERRNPRAPLDSFVRLYELEDVLGGFKPGESNATAWATHEEVDAGAPRYKAVDPETGAYAYDRLRHVGQHGAGKGTATVELTPASGVVTVNGALSNVFRLVLGANVAEMANPINPVNGQTINIHLKQDETGGRVILLWGTQWKFVNRVDPVLSLAGNAIDLLSCQWNETDAIMECAFLPNFGAGEVESPGASDLLFNNVGGGLELIRDQVGINVNFRTLVIEGDLEYEQNADTLVIRYSTPTDTTLNFADLNDVDLTGVVSLDLLRYVDGIIVPYTFNGIDTTQERYLTYEDDRATLPNSIRLVPGLNIDFDYGTEGQLIISGESGGGGGYPPQLGHAGI